MTLAEAETFFKKYNGMEFHMLREESKLYKEYRQLNISKEQGDIWRVEKIEVYHEYIHSGKEAAWGCLSHIIEMMHKLSEVTDNLLEGLLDALDHISTLDMYQRILVMQSMAGYSDNHDDSGYALFQSKNKYFERLKTNMAQITKISAEDMDEMEQLSASGKIGWTNTYNRYLTALRRCERMEKNLLTGKCLEKKQQNPKYDYWEKWLAEDEQ